MYKNSLLIFFTGTFIAASMTNAYAQGKGANANTDGRCNKAPCYSMQKHQPTTQGRYLNGMYGWQLMTDDERMKHRQRMQAAISAEQRQKIRLEHRQEMLRRAKQQNVELLDID